MDAFLYERDIQLNLIGGICVDINSSEEIISRVNHYIIDTNLLHSCIVNLFAQFNSNLHMLLMHMYSTHIWACDLKPTF
ncbi:hypothetical protein [Bacillus proteolyticus]|uniref:hypothetical protein n=1 Tax=Bacillus proteolyticus TaxID=2026192 RepID=UPI003CFCB948